MSLMRATKFDINFMHVVMLYKYIIIVWIYKYSENNDYFTILNYNTPNRNTFHYIIISLDLALI